ncbi:MAG TPA: exopolyphosphatase, partial [Burkholderiales bacterium]|nr:exopolyphosphatase [Burkholderiales bacterium]
MAVYSTLAAVDLGSNSFHLQVARVVGDQLYPLDSLREPIRLGAGLTRDKRLDEASQSRALDCLKRFGERLRGFDPHAVRAIGTNSLRVAKNASSFLKQAETALGFPIGVVAGREEARLIYVGVSHSLPVSKDKRLVVDIGGG